MHHELLFVVYSTLSVLFFSVQDMSAPFVAQPFAWRVYMTTVGTMMIYQWIRIYYKLDDRFAFMCMQWSTYLLCGGTRYPYWMVAYSFYLVMCTVLKDAEQRVAELDEVVMDNGFHFLNVHQLTNDKVTLAIPDEEQKKENKTLQDFRKLRKKEEIPLNLTPHENILWNLSDNTGLVYTREKRRWIILAPMWSLLILYGLWWNALTWYTALDICMLIALLCDDKMLMFVSYHMVFILALVYARHPEFNASMRHV